jgi:hypothetical protein
MSTIYEAWRAGSVDGGVAVRQKGLPQQPHIIQSFSLASLCMRTGVAFGHRVDNGPMQYNGYATDFGRLQS